MGAAREIVNDFAARRWSNDPFGRLYSDPAIAAELVTLAFEQCPNSGTIFHAALSFVSAGEFRELIERALAVLGERKSHPLAEDVIAYASLQMPELLHPRLRTIFDLNPNRRSYYANWPWREAPVEAAPWLEAIVNSSDSERRMKAWRCLLETRQRPAIESALSLAPKVDLRNSVAEYLAEVGFSDTLVQLYSSETMHVIFPDGYFPGEHHHPSWTSDAIVAEARFGGELRERCGLCRGPLHRLIALPQSVSPSDSALTIATCLSCLGWEVTPLFYSHAMNGDAMPLQTSDTPNEPEFPAEALKESQVAIVATDARWRWQDWALSNSRENLHRIGGHPTWVQSAKYPDCPKCNQTMRFILQLDSNLPTEDGGDWLWGSGGVCYVFWCQTCRVSGLLWQCT